MPCYMSEQKRLETCFRWHEVNSSSWEEGGEWTFAPLRGRRNYAAIEGNCNLFGNQNLSFTHLVKSVRIKAVVM